MVNSDSYLRLTRKAKGSEFSENSLAKLDVSARAGSQYQVTVVKEGEFSASICTLSSRAGSPTSGHSCKGRGVLCRYLYSIGQGWFPNIRSQLQRKGSSLQVSVLYWPGLDPQRQVTVAKEGKFSASICTLSARAGSPTSGHSCKGREVLCKYLYSYPH